MSDQFYDVNYEIAKRSEKDRMDGAVERLTRKYQSDIKGEHLLTGKLNSEGESLVRHIARERALRDIESLSRGF